MYGLRPTTSARLGELERAHQERRKAHPGVPCDEPQVLRRCSARGCNPRTAGRLTCSIEAARGAPLRNARRNVGRGNLECRSSIRGFRFFGDDIRASAGASRGAFSQGRGLASACSPWMPVRRPALHQVGVYIRAKRSSSCFDSRPLSVAAKSVTVSGKAAPVGSWKSSTGGGRSRVDESSARWISSRY